MPFSPYSPGATDWKLANQGLAGGTNAVNTLTGASTTTDATGRRRARKRRKTPGYTPESTDTSLVTGRPTSGPGSSAAGSYGDFGRQGTAPLGAGFSTTATPAAAAANRDAAAGSLKSPNPLSLLGGAYGNLSDLGQIQAAANPVVSYGTYFNDLGPGSNTANFYASYFDPVSLGIAAGLGGEIGTSNANIIAFGKSIADMMSGQQGLGQYLDPHTLVANVLTSAAGMTSKNLQNDPSNPLAQLASQTPAQQIDTLMGILRGALASVMPADSLNSYLETLNRIAMQFVGQAGQMPVEDLERSGMNVARFLMQQLGSDFGLGGSLI